MVHHALVTATKPDQDLFWEIRNLSQELAALGHLVQNALPEAPMSKEELAGLGMLLKRLSSQAQALADHVEAQD